jgi:hypothetical protein
MPYGELRVDTITFTNAGVDKSITVSGLFASTSGNLTVTGTISGTTFTGTTASFTSGNVTTFSGGTCTITSGVFASGTATNPSISFIADSNTGFYSPGADQVAISTSGTGRLFVDASGNISNTAGFNPYATTNRGSLTVNGTTDSIFSLGINGVAAGYLYADSVGSTIGAPATKNIIFNINGERARIDSAGRLLVGQATTGLQAARSFSWQGSGEGTFYISHSTSDGNGDPFVKFGYNAGQIGSIIQAGNTGIGIYSNDYFTLGSNNTERVRIDSSGNVGIGTSSPAYALDVNSAVAQVGNSTDAFIQYKSSAGNWHVGAGNVGAYVFYTGTYGSGTERLRIDSSGRVGIGTTGPTRKLVISNSGVEGLEIGPGESSNLNQQVHYNRATATYVTSRVDAASHQFWTATSQAVTIDSSGRLLVGTSTYDGNARAVIQGNTSGGTTGALSIRYNAARPTGADTAIGAIRFESTNQTSSNYHYASIECYSDGASSSDTDIPGRLVFSTTDDGASSPTERMRITSGGYIKASNTGSYTDAGGGSRATNAQHFFRSDQNGLTIQATNTNINTAVEGFTSDFATGATGNHFIGAINLVRVFIVAANGNVTNTNNSYGAISDVKLKANIVDANSQWDDLKALQVRNYNLKEGQTHTQIGLIAQEAELVSPGLVSESPDLDAEGNELGTVTKSVNYSVLYMKAIKALQEAMERIETLEAKVAALEAS